MGSDRERTIIDVVFILLAAVCFAVFCDRPVSGQHPALCRIIVQEPPNFFGLGSGVVIGHDEQDTYIATA